MTRIHAVWTRDFTPGDLSGRVRIMDYLRAGPLADAQHHRLYHLFEARRWWWWPLLALRGLLQAALLRPIPLQVLLFSDPRSVAAVVDGILAERTDCVYLDGVRTAAVLFRLRTRGFRGRVLIDEHDLMSRRMRLLRAHGEAPNPGYLTRRLPGLVRKALNFPRLGQLVLAYETWALNRVEIRMFEQADGVVTLSSVDAATFRASLPSRLRHQRERIASIVPPVEGVHPPRELSGNGLRFIFVGGDNLTQNRVTLERLFSLWRKRRPAIDLHWFGKVSVLGDRIPPGVIAHGYVDDLADAYDGRSILLYPAGLGGGIKTKLLEALAHGCPVVVNLLALEGLEWRDYPMVLGSDAGWEDFIADPVAHLPALREAIRIGQERLERDHHPAIFALRWQEAFSRIARGMPPVPPPTGGLLAGKRVAVVHEWLETAGGSEQVLAEILRCLPSADLYSLVDFRDEATARLLDGRPAATTFIQRMPFARWLFRWYYPLMPLAIEQLDLASYDVVITSSHAVAKGVIVAPYAVQLCYCHSPLRYAWDQQHAYNRQGAFGGIIRSRLTRILLHYLRQWDVSSAARVDLFVANSSFVAQRIARYYRRSALVIHPPVPVESFPLTETKDGAYLTVSRLVPYKRLDLIIQAFNRMPERRLEIIGSGPEEAGLRAIAGTNIAFLGWQSDEVVTEKLSRARAFVFAGEEDFGIVMAEAQACGTPVIAYGQGGSRDIVIDGKTGVLFAHQTVLALIEATERFERSRTSYNAKTIHAHAQRFGSARFQEGFARALGRLAPVTPQDGSDEFHLMP